VCVLRFFRLVPAILLIGAAASQASLFWSSDERQVAEFTGTIAVVDAVSLRIRPDQGSVMTFVVDDSSALPTGLAAGTRVTVRYETREGGGRRLLSVSLAEGSSAPSPESPPAGATATPSAPEPTAALALEASPRSASAALAPDLATPEPRDASATPAPSAPAGAPCPLQVVAVGLLVATGALLVIASWR